MNKKAGLSLLILEIIGGVIVVALMISMFSGFASPFLQFMVDSENIKSFNKFTTVMSSACRSGSGTELYFGPSALSKNEPYTWSLIYYRTASYVSDEMDVCKKGGAVPCTTKDSKDIIKRCKSDFCWCLMRVEFNSTNEKCIKSGNQGILVELNKEVKTGITEDAKQTDKGSSQTRIYGNKIAAQTFKPNSDGILTSIKLDGWYSTFNTCPGSDMGKLKVRILGVGSGGIPNYNDIVGVSEISAVDIGDTTSDNTFTVKLSGVYVRQGQNYAILLISPDTAEHCAFQWSHSSNNYENGTTFTSNDGTSWSDVGYDSYFVLNLRPSEAYSKLDSWDGGLKSALSDKDSIVKLKVLQCTTVREQLGCEKEDFPLVPTYPKYPGDKDKKDEKGYLVWVQPIRSGDTPVKLFFDSFSTDRPIIESGERAGEYDYYINAAPSPLLDVDTYAAGSGAATLTEDCSVDESDYEYNTVGTG